MRAVIGAVVLSGVVFSLNTFAEDKSSGCGLGWQVTKRKSLISSLIRASTNATGSNSFAMTSGTSGCDQHMLILNEKQKIHFAEANYHNLMVEMAQGSGEFLEAFAVVMGCSDSATAGFSKLTRTKYSEIFSRENITPFEMLQNVQNAIQTNSMLRKTCQLI